MMWASRQAIVVTGAGSRLGEGEVDGPCDPPSPWHTPGAAHRLPEVLARRSARRAAGAADMSSATRAARAALCSSRSSVLVSWPRPWPTTGQICPLSVADCRRVRPDGARAAPARPAPAAAGVDRARARRAARRHRPQRAPGRRAAADARLSGERDAGGRRRLPARRRAALPPLLLDDEEAIATAVSLRLARVARSRARARPRCARWPSSTRCCRPGCGQRCARSTTRSSPSRAAGTRWTRCAAGAGARRARPGAGRLPTPRPRREPAVRRVEPYRLVATGRRWYLLAFDLDRDDWRTFRVDRMTEVRARRAVRPREAPDAAAYVQRSVT